MDMPRLGPAHEALTALVGDWVGKEEVAESPWASASTASARASYRVALHGFAVVQEYRQLREDGTDFLGLNVFTVDPATGETLWYGFDSYGFPPDSPARGRWSGDVLTLEKRTERGVARHRFTVGEGWLRHEIDIRMGDAPEFAEFLRAVYARV
jgi:hypothetical protein